MKTAITLLLLTFSLYATSPQWFNQQSLHCASTNCYIGYAQSSTLREAKLLAKKDIANQLASQITSVDTSHASREGEHYSNSFDSTVKQTANVSLDHVIIEKAQKIDTIFYVAVSYENITFEQRLVKRLKEKPCINASQHPYLKQTPLFQQLSSHTHCDYDLNVVRKNSDWGLAYEDIFLRIPHSKIHEFYITTHNNSLSLTPSLSELKEGQLFNFNITSQKEGFVTILDIYANGIVTVIEPNIVVKKETSLIYPDEKSTIELRASTLDQKSETYDLYVAVFTKTPLNVDQFTPASGEIETETFHYNFDKVLYLMQQHTFSSTLLRIKP